MILKDAVKKVEKSKDFKALKKENPQIYLAHGFTMIDESTKEFSWELGYYNPKTDKLFVFETDPVQMKAEDEIFKKEDTVKKLEMKTVKVGLTKILEICDELLKAKYSSQSITKKIIVCQNLEKPVYNLTLVSRTFHIVNMKIDSETGEVISHNMQSLMSLGKFESGIKD